MFLDKQIVKESVKVASPLLLSLLLQNLVNVVDTIFLGRVGEIELGASALAGIFYMALYLTGFGFGVGAQALISRRNGEKRYTRIGVIVWQSILFLSAFAVIAIIVTNYTAPIWFRSVIDSDDVFIKTIEYLDYRVYGLVPAFIAVVFRAFFVAVKNTKVLMYSSFAMTVANCILNYILIFGNQYVDPMGIKGAAIASVVAEFIGLIVFVVYTKNIDTSKFNLFKKFGVELVVIQRIFRLSGWTMLQFFLTVFTWLLFFLAIEQTGERPLAVSNLVRSMSTMLFVAVSAFATSASSLAGNALGEGKKENVIPITKVNIVLSYMVLLPLIAVVAIFPHATLRIFTDSESLIQDSVYSLYVLLSYFIILVPAFTIFNVVSGTGNTKTSLIMEVLALVFYVLGLLLIVEYKPVVHVCWMLEYVYWGFILIFGVIYLAKAKWWEKEI